MKLFTCGFFEKYCGCWKKILIKLWPIFNLFLSFSYLSWFKAFYIVFWSLFLLQLFYLFTVLLCFLSLFCFRFFSSFLVLLQDISHSIYCLIAAVSLSNAIIRRSPVPLIRLTYFNQCFNWMDFNSFMHWITQYSGYGQSQKSKIKRGDKTIKPGH